MSDLIGTVSEIMRYPIKSFAGESFDTCTVLHHGLEGDRGYAFIDETKQGFSRYVTSRQIPEMLQYKAEWVGQTFEKNISPIKVTSPDGRILHWDELLLEEMQTFTQRKISMFSCIPNEVELMAVDCASVLLVTDASIKKMEQLWRKPLDRRRFRANFVFTLADDEPFIESEWVNRMLQIGDVELKVDIECKRCMMVTIDPDNLNKDNSLLNEIVVRRNQNFGVYASVVKQGTIKKDDAVYLKK